MEKRKNFIVIEGSDGSGKTEQVRLLVEHLEREGKKVAQFSFPRYKTPAAVLVEKYLAGEYGKVEDVPPEKASAFYAFDRLAAAPEIEAALSCGDVVISNRYKASNDGYQGAKIGDEDERKLFFEWGFNFEYGILGIPRPAINIVLHVSPEVSWKLIDERNAARYGSLKKPRDIHEENQAYLAKVTRTYLEIARFYPEDFRLIDCVEMDRLLSREEIHEKIWVVVMGILER